MPKQAFVTQTSRPFVLFFGRGLRKTEYKDLIFNRQYGIGFFNRRSLPYTLKELDQLTASGQDASAITDKLLESIGVPIGRITYLMVRRQEVDRYDPNYLDRWPEVFYELCERASNKLEVVILESDGTTQFTSLALE